MPKVQQQTEQQTGSATTDHAVAPPTSVSNAAIQEEISPQASSHTPRVPSPPFAALLPEEEDHSHVHQEELQRTVPATAAKDPVGGTGAAPATEISGIGSSVAITRFVGTAKEVQTDWGTLTAQERADKLAGAANSELKTVGVPECATSLGDLGNNAGELDFTTWTLALGQAPFSAAAVTDAEAADMADTVYHEARHAEQWHRMARYAGGLGKTAAEIQSEMFLPARVTADAFANKYDICNAESTEAESWYENVYGTGAAERNRVISALGTLATALSTRRTALTAAEAAYTAAKDDPAITQPAKDALHATWVAAYAAWQTAKTAKDANYQLYRALAEEADAWQVGGAVQAAFLA